MSEEVKTINPIPIPELENVIDEKATSQKIIKFCCNCGIEFSQLGETGKYFGCKNCGIVVKVNVLDSAKL